MEEVNRGGNWAQDEGPLAPAELPRNRFLPRFGIWGRCYGVPALQLAPPGRTTIRETSLEEKINSALVSSGD